MNVILEGPDASGKTTLARYLRDKLGWPIISSDGPCSTQEEFDARAEHHLGCRNTIFDRHCLVSERIYGPMRGKSFVKVDQLRRFKNADKLVVYSRVGGLPHIEKDHDSPEHLEMVRDKQRKIRLQYDIWAVHEANIIYRGNRRPILDAIRQFDPVRDVENFHQKFHINYDGKPRALDFELLQFRLKFLRQELNEYEEHADAALFELDKLTRSPEFATGEFAFDNANFVHHLSQSLDALIDITYVALGTAHLHGFDVREAWRRVHIANMAKQQAEGEARNAEERIKLRMVKPPGWEPPKHDDLVEDHAHPQEHTP